MDVGAALIFQGTDPSLADRDVYLNELKMGDLAIDLGFQSIWSVEHHFTDYTMCPDVTQFLSYWAGRNPDVLLGSMVIVLPWHDPMRVAEEISMLDNMSDGRMVLGVGQQFADARLGFHSLLTQRCVAPDEVLLDVARDNVIPSLSYHRVRDGLGKFDEVVVLVSVHQADLVTSNRSPLMPYFCASGSSSCA